MNATTEPRDDAGRAAKGPRWYLWDVVLLGLLFSFGAFSNAFPLFFYWSGLHNSKNLPFGATMWMVLLVPVAGICLLATLVRIVVCWPRHVARRRKRLLLQIVTFLSILIYLGLPFTRIMPSGFKAYMRGFRKYAHTNVNVNIFRMWLDTVDPNDCDGALIDIRPDDDGVQRPVSTQVDLPTFVLDLEPRYVELSLDEMKRPTVHLLWGSGMLGTWGLTIGSAEMETPDTLPTTEEVLPNGQTIYNYGQYRLPLAAGAYVWHDLE